MDFFDHVEAANPGGPEVIDLGDFKVYRPHKAIMAGNHKVSIQANETSYCRPRVDGLNFRDYEAFEIALWLATDDKREAWATPENTAFLAPWADLWAGDDVAGFVPAATIQAIIDAACDAAVTETKGNTP